MILTQKGKEFAITLESNRSTGYLWELTRPVDEAVVSLVRSEYRQADTGRPGAPGIETWTFVASGAGETEIAMKYVRPWEAGAAPARTAVFKIVVRR